MINLMVLIAVNCFILLAGVGIYYESIALGLFVASIVWGVSSVAVMITNRNWR